MDLINLVHALPWWFYFIDFALVFVYALAKFLQKKKYDFLGAGLEALVAFVFIFILQLSITYILDSKLILDIKVDPATEVLSITNKGSIPAEDVTVYSTTYITASPETFASSSTKIFFSGQPWVGPKNLNKNESIDLTLDNGKFFIFYNADNKLTKASTGIIQNEMDASGSPIFFEPYGTTTIASENNIYYYFRISFKNSLTKEEQVRYIIITAQEGTSWFNSVPSTESSGGSSSGSYTAIEGQLQIKNTIFKQEQLEWNDTDSEYYNAF